MITTQLFKHAAMQLFTNLINTCVGDEWYRWIHTMKLACSKWKLGNIFVYGFFCWISLSHFFTKFSVWKHIQTCMLVSLFMTEFQQIQHLWSYIFHSNIYLQKIPKVILTNLYQ